MRKLLLLALGLILLSGCKDYVEMTPQQLRTLNNTAATAWRGTYYCGSDGTHDYFRYTYEVSSDILVKVKTGEVILPKRIPFPAKKSDWINVSELLMDK